mmetsp:Transcript_45310/g.45716  ORF Transcript_45310/g.45716 Transcript_45310/m.45716 type:complete len:205 (-) Transcript_45310:223-837(-)
MCWTFVQRKHFHSLKECILCYRNHIWPFQAFTTKQTSYQRHAILAEFLRFPEKRRFVFAFVMRLYLKSHNFGSSQIVGIIQKWWTACNTLIQNTPKRPCIGRKGWISPPYNFGRKVCQSSFNPFIVFFVVAINFFTKHSFFLSTVIFKRLMQVDFIIKLTCTCLLGCGFPPVPITKILYHIYSFSLLQNSLGFLCNRTTGTKIP